MSKNTVKPVAKKLTNKVRTKKRKIVGVVRGTTVGLLAGLLSLPATALKRLYNLIPNPRVKTPNAIRSKIDRMTKEELLDELRRVK